ncbi:MAG: hypothetical protein ACPHSA_09370 [Cycloclasticus pugetii]|uniref:hypothetical protein n=1 Tax=Cycloclasticus TaxID=34067 RepID=UPI000286AB1E|nr:hypothetical protein [Cycloclasticus sp. P1]AFT67374.1 hypothetical protein Q91_1337 [Cycloclasticus sp. P1]
MQKTIDKFFEVCRAGAFIKNPSEAHRALRSIDGYSKITSKEIRDLAGDTNLNEPREAFDLLLQLVFVALADMRQSSVNEKKLSNLLREVLGPIGWYLTNLETNDSDKGTKKYKVYVSKSIISLLEKNKKPEVVYEHKVPIKVIREEMIEDCLNLESVCEYLKKNLKAVFITKNEDQALSALKLRDSRPENGDRYTRANIALYEQPVFFRRGHSSMKFIRKHS